MVIFRPCISTTCVCSVFIFVNHLMKQAALGFTSFNHFRVSPSVSGSLRSASIMKMSTDTAPDLPPQDDSSKRIFWVRHGEVINPGGTNPVYYGALDVELSPLGQREAVAAGKYLSRYDLAQVFCSPLKRAVYGAEQVLKQQKKNNREVIILDGFKELDRGAWAMRTKKEIGLDLVKRFDDCDESVTPDRGESYPQLKQRVLEARDTSLSQLDPGQAGAVVSHLQVTRSVLSEALGIPVEKMTELPVGTASVTCIDYNDTNNNSVSTVHFQSYKPESGLPESIDAAN